MSRPAPLEPDVMAVRERADGIEIDLVVPPDAYCLQGHFPDMPIVPGVAQVDWAVTFADRYLGTAIGSATDFRVKFRAVLRPSVPVTLDLRRTPPARDGTTRMAFEFRAPGQVFSSGTVRLDRAA